MSDTKSETENTQVETTKSKTFLEHVKSTLKCPFVQGTVLVTCATFAVYLYRSKKN